MVLATVYGDVHDIGKNLVKTILSNNGYTVHDLGKQVPVATIIEKAVEVGADAIGLSALLVSTSKQMPLLRPGAGRAADLAFPVIIGGAAINRRFGLRAHLFLRGRRALPGRRLLRQGRLRGARAGRAARRSRRSARRCAARRCEKALQAPQRAGGRAAAPSAPAPRSDVRPVEKPPGPAVLGRAGGALGRGPARRPLAAPRPHRALQAPVGRAGQGGGVRAE